jgi:hypothetical protein
LLTRALATGRKNKARLVIAKLDRSTVFSATLSSLPRSWTQALNSSRSTIRAIRTFNRT